MLCSLSFLLVILFYIVTVASGILLPFTWHFASLEYSYFKFIVFHAGFQLNQFNVRSKIGK